MWNKQLAEPSDTASLSTIYQRYAPVLFAYLQRHTGSQEDTEDLLLEVFLAALERPGFEQMGAREQEVWLWCVARNKLIDHQRKQGRRRGVSLTILPEEEYEQDAETPELLVLRQEEQQRLQASIQRLPALQQEIVRLRFITGLRSAEIATIVNKSEGAVRVILSRALKQLRTIYEKE